MKPDRTIGVIGGMGPHAGLDLVLKLLDQTQANTDFAHLPIALLSYPGEIPDRSPFLFGETDENPAYALAGIAGTLAALGATVAGIPCNTAHGPRIYDVMEAEIARQGYPIRILHLIEETVRFVMEHWPQYRRIGVLSTLATYQLGLYQTPLEAAGLTAVLPDEAVEHIVNRTIFDTGYGLKAQANPPSKIARQSLLDALNHLREKGAEAVILGCTELPLAIPEAEINGLPMIDPAVALARALIRETFPEKLKPF
jgi:aspartate racemase